MRDRDGTPAAHRKPRTALARPAIDSTERSISPAMMTSVIGSAMIATSIRAASRFEKLRGVRKNGDSALPSDDQPEQDDEQQRLPARQRARGRARHAARELVAAVIGRASRRRARWIRRSDERVGADGEQDHDPVDRLQPELRQPDEDERVGDEAQEERAERRARRRCRCRRRC